MTPLVNKVPVKVLLVEDDEDDYIITRDLISEINRNQYALDWVSTYEAGLEAIQRGEHDLYLVDYRLGPHDGLELLRFAVARGCPAPVILLTAMGDRRIDIAAMKAGAADYLIKGQITAALLERSLTHSLERKNIERRLRESEEQYRLLFEQNPHPMWVAEAETLQIVAVNEAAVSHYGYSREEFLQMRLHHLAAKDPPSWAPRLSVPSHHPHGTWRHQKKNGELIDVQVTSNRISFRGKDAWLILGQDVTQRLALEAQLRQSQKMESIGILAGGVAHDFNNILAIISGYASYLRLDHLAREDWRKGLDAIDKAVQRGTALVKQILTFARKTEVSLRPTDANSLVEELGKMLANTFPKAITFAFDLQNNLPGLVVDASQLHQALLNLCVNARDAMPGGGTLSLRTSVIPGNALRPRFADAEERDYVCISVGDTGVGMDETVRSRLFEPFFTTKGRERGTGLGLAVAYGIVKSHRGFIEAESELGQGTTFRIYLPVDSLEREPPAAAAEPKDTARGAGTILLVEDEPLLLEVMRSLLEHKGYQVLEATDGLEAVEMYQRHHPQIDLVIADLGLPKLGGWEAFLKMKAINGSVRALFASGYLDPDLRNNILRHEGPLDFIQKPYVPNEIFRKVERLLHRTRQPS